MSITMKNLRISNWRKMHEAVSVMTAAGNMGWGECSIWILIRKRKIKWAVRGVRVVVDLRALMTWVDKNPKVARKLKEKIGIDQKHPLT